MLALLAGTQPIISRAEDSRRPNIILIVTDNGTTAGCIDQEAAYPYFNAGLRGDFETWWTSLGPATKHTVRYVLGGDENPMNASDWKWTPQARAPG